ncbi:MAG: DUF4012 domain-containing protein [Anaerolineae bacterium]
MSDPARWEIVYNSLWVVGLATGLAALSMASYQARMERVRLWHRLNKPGFQFPFGVGLALLCLGLLLASSVWSQRVVAIILGGLACGFIVQSIRATRRQAGRHWTQIQLQIAPAPPAAREASPLQAAARTVASLEIWLVGLLVFASLFSTRILPWAVLLAGGFWLVRWVAYGHPSVRTPADLGILGILLMIPVTLWITTFPDTTRILAYRLLCGVALYYAIVNWSTTVTRQRLLMIGIVSAGLLLAVYAMASVQWVAWRLAVLQSVLYDHLPWLVSDQVNPNVMAGSLVILVPFAPSSLLFSWPQLQRPYRVLAALATVVTIGVLAATQSRSALLALLVILIVMMSLRAAEGIASARARRRAWLVALALALAASITAGWLVASGVASPVFEALMSSRTLGGFEDRLQVWSRALYILQDFPLTGVGMGSFEQVTNLLYPLFIAPGGSITHAHNLFLQVAVDLGLPGLVAWLSILILVVAVSWRVYHLGRVTGDSWLAGLGAGLICSQIALAVHGIVNVSVWGEIRAAPIVWAVWGLAMASYGYSRVALSSTQTHGQRSPHDVPDSTDVPRLPQPEGTSTGDPVPRPGRASSASKRVTRVAWGSILVGSLLILGWVLFAALQLFDRAHSLQGHLGHLESLAQADGSALAELESAGEHLAGMRQDLEAIQSLVGPLLPVGRALGWVPQYGGDLAAAPELMDLAVGVAVSGDRIFQVLSPALDVSTVPPASPLGERLLPVLVTAQPELRGIRQELAAVEESRTHLQISALSPPVAGLLVKLDRYLPWLQTAVDGALLVPGLLGADKPRAYLILAQNNHELRATGGFISGVGELWVEAGDIASLSFRDSYAVDNLQVAHEVAPLDFQKVLGGELWFFRDTNWSPDFPTSAQRALEVYARDQGVQAGGVITLDLTALQLLVDAVGPLQVEGMDEPVTGRNVVQMIQAAWGGPPPATSVGTEGVQSQNDQVGGTAQDAGQWWLQRKDFMGHIARAALDRVVKRTGISTDGHLVKLARARFNKADPNVERSIRYEVDLAATEGPRARLTLTYRNRSTRPEAPSEPIAGAHIPAGSCIQESRYGETYADMMERCYWDYLRAYVPKGSRLLSGPELLLPPGSLLARHSSSLLRAQPISPTMSVDGGEVWAAFFDLPAVEEKVLVFDYQLPASVLDTEVRDPDGLFHYRLRVQKQPGTEAVPLRIEITLPPGAELVDPPSSLDGVSPLDGPPGSPPSSGLATWAGNLRLDREFVIVFRQR